MVVLWDEVLMAKSKMLRGIVDVVIRDLERVGFKCVIYSEEDGYDVVLTLGGHYGSMTLGFYSDSVIVDTFSSGVEVSYSNPDFLDKTVEAVGSGWGDPKYNPDC